MPAPIGGPCVPASGCPPPCGHTPSAEGQASSGKCALAPATLRASSWPALDILRPAPPLHDAHPVGCLPPALRGLIATSIRPARPRWIGIAAFLRAGFQLQEARMTDPIVTVHLSSYHSWQDRRAKRRSCRTNSICSPPGGESRPGVFRAAHHHFDRRSSATIAG